MKISRLTAAVSRRLLLPLAGAIALSLLLSGCPAMTKEGKAAEQERFGGVTSNPHQSAQFAAFVGKLRRAVSLRDHAMLTRMMTPDFGFDFNSSADGPQAAFQYWNQYGLWPELERILGGEFRTKDRFIVAPPAFVLSTADKPYTGFRAGFVETSNGFRFAYFVSDQSPMPSGGQGMSTSVYQETMPAGGDMGANTLPLPQSQGEAGPRVYSNPGSMEYSPVAVPQYGESGVVAPGPMVPAR